MWFNTSLTGRLAVLMLLASASLAASAQSDGKNMEVAVGASVQGKSESNSYGSLRITRTLDEKTRLELLSTFGSRKRFVGPGFVIRYGGSDVEARYIRTLEGHAQAYVGLAIADTPAGRRAPFLTVGAESRMWGSDQLSVSVVGRAASRASSTLIGTGFRWDASSGSVSGFAEGLWVSGDENTYSVRTGAREQRAVYRLGIRPDISQRFKLELGFTNALGRTTGMSLTPGLGNGSGGYVELSVRF